MSSTPGQVCSRFLWRLWAVVEGGSGELGVGRRVEGLCGWSVRLRGGEGQ